MHHDVMMMTTAASKCCDDNHLWWWWWRWWVHFVVDFVVDEHRHFVVVVVVASDALNMAVDYGTHVRCPNDYDALVSVVEVAKDFDDTIDVVVVVEKQQQWPQHVSVVVNVNYNDDYSVTVVFESEVDATMVVVSDDNLGPMEL